jgi:sigma-B regulation protein RsbU (phosphoserine phosphatase)
MSKMMESEKVYFFNIGTRTLEDWTNVRISDSLDEKSIAEIAEPLLMVFPLFIIHNKFGLLYVMESEKGYEYREKKAEIIAGIARHISLAIQGDHLKKEMIDQERVKKEFQLAREIQQTFLPDTLPSMNGWEVNATWRPAQQVGGDFYDAFVLDDEHMGLVIADVSDKGFPAALYMTVARTLIHAEALEGDSPAETLSRVNRLLMLNSQQGLFVTCLYTIINTLTGDLVYANAGHNQPLWLRKSREKVEWLEKGGMPLGVIETLNLANNLLQVKKGDHLLLYTDGVTDTQSADGTMFGEERLFNLLNLYKDMPYPSLIESVDGRLSEFRGDTPPTDDLTLLSLQRRE